MNFIKKISQCTEENDHTGAVKLLAEAMGEKKTAKILDNIESIHMLEGSLNFNLSLYRLDIFHGLLERAKGFFTADVLSKIQRAF